MGTTARDESFTEAFDELFVRAFRVARRIVGDTATAEDVAAEAMARAYARWERIGSTLWREGWVVRVATNLAIDVTRTRSRGREPTQHSAIAGVPGAPDPSGDAAVVRTALIAALQRLPKRQREVVVLRYLADMSELEVAASLGVSPGAVKSHLHRGVGALRARMGPAFTEVAFDV